VLAILFWIVAYGLLSILRWSLTQLVSQLVGSLTMLARAIPLLLFFALVLFINTEMWQVFGNIPTSDLLGVIALFVALGSLFLGIRLPREVQELAERENVQPDLSRRQRLNVGLVMFVSYSLQTLVVALAVGLFFVCFGLLTTPTR
jgi:fatty acid desaturase